VVLIALFVGGKKLPELARGFGRFTTEFRRGKAEAEHELEEIKHAVEEK